MKIARTTVTRFRLRLREPLETAHGTVSEREGFLLALFPDDGTVGFGEATPLPGFGAESVASCAAAFEAIAKRILGRDPRALGERLDDVEASAPLAPAARAAADAALHDLAAQIEDRSVAAMLAGVRRAPRQRIPVNALLSGPTATEVEAQARRAVAEGFATLKLKVGLDPEGDLARVAAAKRACGPATRIRIDANGAWSEDEARRILERLVRFDLEWVEQPVPAHDLAAFARLRRASPVPLAADESASSEDAARRVLAGGCADVLVLKPSVLGGLRTARRIALAAQRAGIDVVVTSLLDSGLGIAAATHLAASLPGHRYAAGLATQGLLVEDLIDPLDVTDGSLQLPPGSGFGVAPCPRRLERLALAPPQEMVA
jgi:o-succinylbenzoate synthase